jgi:hypothetical protein
MRSGLAILAIGLICAPAMAQEMESDERGVWVADVNPTTLEMLVTDCPCESSPGVNFICKRGAGSAHAELQDFLGAKGEIGGAVEIALDIDGTKSTRAATLADYGGDNLPVFDVALDDTLFDTLSAGKLLKLSHGGETAESPLKGSRKAIAAMRDYCKK